MKRHFTDDEIICFLYDEMDPESSNEFMDALCVDEDLWKRYEHFQETVEQLSDLKYEPSQLSVDKVRAYVYKGQVPEGPVLEEISRSPQPKPSSALSTGKILSLSVNLNAVVLVAVLLFVSVAVTGTFLQLKRGTPGIQTSQPLVQEHFTPVKWDDSDLGVKLDEIWERVQDLEKTTQAKQKESTRL